MNRWRAAAVTRQTMAREKRVLAQISQLTAAGLPTPTAAAAVVAQAADRGAAPATIQAMALRVRQALWRVGAPIGCAPELHDVGRAVRRSQTAPPRLAPP